jgi:hypothetical protein
MLKNIAKFHKNFDDCSRVIIKENRQLSNPIYAIFIAKSSVQAGNSHRSFNCIIGIENLKSNIFRWRSTRYQTCYNNTRMPLKLWIDKSIVVQYGRITYSTSTKQIKPTKSLRTNTLQRVLEQTQANRKT